MTADAGTDQPLTVLVMAGGTGGHIYPALAVADLLRRDGCRVVWLGARGGMEASIVSQAGLPIELIAFGGLRGKGLLAKLLLPTRLLVAFWQALRVLRAVRPHVVLGLGGYASFPGGMMATLLGIPLVVHEQNSVAGLANRVLAGVADRILGAFPGALRNAEHVGNPVREDMLALEPPGPRYERRTGPLKVLVVGGSQGAQALNETVPQALARMPAESRPLVTHQAGAKNLETLRRQYAAAHADGLLVPYIEDMARAYADADLVIGRAGAMTVAELAAVGVASILVPFPHAVDDHQTVNARYLADADAAILCPQSGLSADTLAKLLVGLQRQRLREMAERAFVLGRRDATRAVAEACLSLARQRRGAR